MHKMSNSGRLRSPDGLKSSVFKAIRNMRTTAENDVENICCPFARVEDELEIADFGIFGNSEMNVEQKPTLKLQEKNNDELSQFCAIDFKNCAADDNDDDDDDDDDNDDDDDDGDDDLLHLHSIINIKKEEEEEEGKEEEEVVDVKVEQLKRRRSKKEVWKEEEEEEEEKKKRQADIYLVLLEESENRFIVLFE
uniref:Uncharacterized protein n=1 Tax=Loa loa TaxID=7209 RepID=A0A1I7VH10_LOALO